MADTFCPYAMAPYAIHLAVRHYPSPDTEQEKHSPEEFRCFGRRQGLTDGKQVGSMSSAAHSSTTKARQMHFIGHVKYAGRSGGLRMSTVFLREYFMLTQRQVTTEEGLEVSMGQDIDERVRELLHHLAIRMPDAALEYEHIVDIHRFVIWRVGLCYSLCFPDWVLRSKGMEELKDRITPAIHRVLLGAAPRRVWVGGWQARART